MHVLVSYDVSTLTPKGRNRLRRVARICQNFGQRVQFSVFECSVGPTELARLRQELLVAIDEAEDSLRLYFLGEDPGRRAEHYGQKPSVDFGDALIV